MTKATTTSTVSRRGMLVGTTAALLGAVSLASCPNAAAGEGQDSALLMACAEFHRTQAELDHWYATGWELEPADKRGEAYRLWKAENDRFFWANRDAFEVARDMPAKTQAGIVAKSKVLAAHLRDVMKDDDATDDETFAYSLAQNVAQIAGGVA